MVRGLTHRMNNILTLFTGHVGLLLENERLDASTQQALLKIKDGAQAASELMDRTHSLVRPSTLVWREIDLGEFVSRLNPGFEALRVRDTQFGIYAQEGLPHVWGDLGRIKTAIFELVRNAFDASPDGGTVRIELRAEAPVRVASAASQPIRWVSLTVSDEGPGVPPEAVEKIFTPFFTLKQKQNAAGLGLTVALGFVQQLGGAIRYRRDSGRTVFELVLPSRSDAR